MLSSIYTLAQSKISATFIPITYDFNTLSGSDAIIIQKPMFNSFVENKKLTVADREKLSEAFMDSNDVITDGISKGPSYLIYPSILSIQSIR